LKNGMSGEGGGDISGSGADVLRINNGWCNFVRQTHGEWG